jgi:molybdopterin synthase sulfurtransferase
MQDLYQYGLSRRDFLKGAGLLVLGAGLAGSGLLTSCKSGAPKTLNADYFPAAAAGLPNAEKLVSARWVSDLVSGKTPPTFKGGKYVVLEVNWGPPDAYSLGHVPGSIHLDTDEIEALPLWNFRSDAELELVWKALGITRDTTVVVYDSDDSIAAARALIGLMRAGVTDVRLMDGGYKSWKSSGYTAETKSNARVPVADFGAKIPAHPEYIIPTASDLRPMMSNPNLKLAAIRSWEEVIGDISGYSYIKPKGSVPGTAWGHDIPDIENADTSMKDYHQIRSMWGDWGINGDKKVVFYCGTGWRASLAWFYAYLMGWKDIAIYDGGWFEWSMDPGNAIQTGDPRITNPAITK